jgi:hypothetical protein
LITFVVLDPYLIYFPGWIFLGLWELPDALDQPTHDANCLYLVVVNFVTWKFAVNQICPRMGCLYALLLFVFS